MAITKEKKQKQIKELANLLINQKSIIFADIKGLDCQSLFHFRKIIKPKLGSIKIIKKTLAVRAFQDKGYQIAKDDLIGQTALIFDSKDNSILKLSYKFAQENKHFKIINGFFDNKLINKEEVSLLATAPPKEIIFQQITGIIKNPLSQLIFVFNQSLRKLIIVLQGIAASESKDSMSSDF